MYTLKTLSLLCLCCASSFCWGQFAISPSASWYFIKGDHWESEYEKINYRVAGDTLLASQTYQRIQSTHRLLDMSEPYFTGDTLYYVERQEMNYLRSEGSRWYTWSATQGEQLIIDFDISVGDTIAVRGYPSRAVIVREDAVQLGTNTHKVYVTELNNRIYSGIGTSAGLFFINSWLGDQSFSLLKCFSTAGESYELESDSWLGQYMLLDDCADYVNITHTNQASSDLPVSVYPNPFGEQLLVDASTYPHAEGALYNLAGECVYQFNYDGDVQSLEVASLPAGIYLLRLRTPHGSLLRKLVKL